MKNKLLAILLSAVLSIGLWFYVITVVSPESEKTYYDIPVVLQNKNILTERGLMVVSDETNVTLALKSDRTILNELNESNINVIVNVANIEAPGTYNLTYNIAYPGNISDNDISVQSSSTDLITLKIENRVTKTVPVVVNYGDTAVPVGYMADKENAELDYEEIEISGPEPVVNQIEQAIIRIDLNGQTKTLAGEYQYVLCNKQGEAVDAAKVTVEAEKVNLMVKIQRVKEIALKLDVVDGGGATEENSTITMDATQIQISGTDTLLEGLDELVVGVVDLGMITEDVSLIFPVILPEGVDNQTGVEQVTVDIKLPKLTTKTLRISNITYADAPEGLSVDIITKAMTVTVRGPEKQVKQIRESDLAVVVNLAEAQAGTVTTKAEVVINSTYSEVGVVGTYPVSVNLREG